MRDWLRTRWKRFLAFYRLDLKLVCEMSDDEHEYHDYMDDVACQPWHFVRLECARCGRRFYI